MTDSKVFLCVQNNETGKMLHYQTSSISCVNKFLIDVKNMKKKQFYNENNWNETFPKAPPLRMRNNSFVMNSNLMSLNVNVNQGYKSYKTNVMTRQRAFTEPILMNFTSEKISGISSQESDVSSVFHELPIFNDIDIEMGIEEYDDNEHNYQCHSPIYNVL